MFPVAMSSNCALDYLISVSHVLMPNPAILDVPFAKAAGAPTLPNELENGSDLTPRANVKRGLGCFSPNLLDETMIPDVNDTTITKPTAGAIRVSQEAIDARLRRIFQPSVSGKYKCSAEIVQQWKCKKGRKSLEQLFQSCGFNPDRVLDKIVCFQKTTLRTTTVDG